MTSVKVFIIDEGTETEVSLSDEGFAVELDGSLYAPAVTTNIEKEKSSDTTRLSDQCGNFERRNVANRGWAVRVEGIATGESRDNNLSLDRLDEVAASEEIEIVCDLYDGPIAVQNVVVTQANDLISISTPETPAREKAYEFQLQLGEPQGDGNN